MLGLDDGRGIAEPRQVADVAGELFGRGRALLEQAGLAGGLQLGAGTGAEVGAEAVDAVERIGFEEGLHLLAEGRSWTEERVSLQRSHQEWPARATSTARERGRRRDRGPG